jgi:hypothetical protein
VDISRIFSTIFNDPQWVGKLAVTALITLFALFTTPLLIGLAGWAVLLGYQVTLINNVRAGLQYPLPRWDDISEYFGMGAQALVGAILYALPLALFGCCIAAAGAVMGEGGRTIISLASCCLLPLLLVYVLIITPMFTLGLGRFGENPTVNVFLQFQQLFGLLSAHRSDAIAFLIGSVILSLIFGVLSGTIIGIPVMAALLVPANGLLAAQFVVRVLGGAAQKTA